LTLKFSKNAPNLGQPPETILNMGGVKMPLTDIQIKNLKPAEKSVRVFDGNGLYLEVSPAGGKLFRFKYRFNGKGKTLSLGKYPDVSLSDARKAHQKAREQLAAGIDPSALKREQKLKQTKTFEVVATEWWQTQRPKWTDDYANTVWRRLENDILPWLKNRPIDELTTAELLAALRRVESRGAIDSAHRICQYLNNIGIYSVACGYIQNNPANNLVKALKQTLKRPMAAITEPKQIKILLKAIDEFEGSFIVKQALRIAPLVFVRPGELRMALWGEIDLEEGLWIIPSAKMKMRRDHIVPLSRQAIEILDELRPLTGNGTYVFPSVRTNARPISENTINAALRRMGYSKDEMTGHGFRTMASTRLHELGWKSEIIEFQLAHADKNKIRGVYNRAEYLEDRKKMMQAWADYLESLKTGADVISFRGAS
jgi:integrase